LREVEVALAQGATVALAVRDIEVTEQTYYRWRRLQNLRQALEQRPVHRFGAGHRIDQAERSNYVTTHVKIISGERLYEGASGRPSDLVTNHVLGV
jgi:transposase-like protein